MARNQGWCKASSTQVRIALTQNACTRLQVRLLQRGRSQRKTFLTKITHPFRVYAPWYVHAPSSSMAALDVKLHPLKWHSRLGCVPGYVHAPLSSMAALDVKRQLLKPILGVCMQVNMHVCSLYPA